MPPSAGRLSKRLVKNVDYFQVDLEIQKQQPIQRCKTISSIAIFHYLVHWFYTFWSSTFLFLTLSDYNTILIYYTYRCIDVLVRLCADLPDYLPTSSFAPLSFSLPNCRTRAVYNPPEYLQSNYVLVFLILVIYCLISSPLLLIVIAGAGGAAYFASIKNETRKIAIAGTTLNWPKMKDLTFANTRPRSNPGPAVRCYRHSFDSLLPTGWCWGNCLLGNCHSNQHFCSIFNHTQPTP